MSFFPSLIRIHKFYYNVQYLNFCNGFTQFEKKTENNILALCVNFKDKQRQVNYVMLK